MGWEATRALEHVVCFELGGEVSASVPGPVAGILRGSLGTPLGAGEGGWRVRRMTTVPGR